MAELIAHRPSRFDDAPTLMPATRKLTFTRIKEIAATKRWLVGGILLALGVTWFFVRPKPMPPFLSKYTTIARPSTPGQGHYREMEVVWVKASLNEIKGDLFRIEERGHSSVMGFGEDRCSTSSAERQEFGTNAFEAQIRGLTGLEALPMSAVRSLPCSVSALSR